MTNKAKTVMIPALSASGELIDVQFQSVSTHPLIIQLSKQRDELNMAQNWKHGYDVGILRGRIIESDTRDKRKKNDQ